MSNLRLYKQGIIAVLFILATILGILTPYYTASKTSQLVLDQSPIVKPVPFWRVM